MGYEKKIIQWLPAKTGNLESKNCLLVFILHHYFFTEIKNKEKVRILSVKSYLFDLFIFEGMCLLFHKCLLGHLF